MMNILKFIVYAGLILGLIYLGIIHDRIELIGMAIGLTICFLLKKK